MSINPSVTDDHFRFIQHMGEGELPQPPIVLEQVMSLEGCDFNMIAIRHKDEKCTRIVNVSYDANETPIGQHVTFKFVWNSERLASICEKKCKIVCNYMVPERSKQHLTYFGDYQISQSLTVNMRKARTVEP
jgi:hypothetical protein